MRRRFWENLTLSYCQQCLCSTCSLSLTEATVRYPLSHRSQIEDLTDTLLVANARLEGLTTDLHMSKLSLINMHHRHIWQTHSWQPVPHWFDALFHWLRFVRGKYLLSGCRLSLANEYQIPCNIVLKRTTPKLWLPTLTLAWGVVATLMGVTQNLAGFFAVRFL